MTREEAIANLNMISVAFVEPVTKEQRKLIDDTFDMAIKALEQEPKTDTWSIKEVADTLEKHGLIREQEPKIGHWIEKDGFDGDVYYDCSECGESWATIEGTPWQNGMNYCPNCGARMQESEG